MKRKLTLIGTTSALALLALLAGCSKKPSNAHLEIGGHGRLILSDSHTNLTTWLDQYSAFICVEDLHSLTLAKWTSNDGTCSMRSACCVALYGL